MKQLWLFCPSVCLSFCQSWLICLSVARLCVIVSVLQERLAESQQLNQFAAVYYSLSLAFPVLESLTAQHLYVHNTEDIRVLEIIGTLGVQLYSKAEMLVSDDHVAKGLHV